MSQPDLIVEELFRTKYGEVLAALLRFAHYQDFDLVEEAVQTAFQRALEKWQITGTPQNPSGWLFIVARNAYGETVRRRHTETEKLAALPATKAAPIDEFAQAEEFTDSAVAQDDLAAMILLCCNPELPAKAQVCLTLKAACGFSVKEIARALGMQEEAVKKSITRAKEKVAEDRHALHALNPHRIALRFGLVLATLYALFNEGYAASSGESQLRRDIAEEAIRLTGILLHSMFTPAAAQGELYALLALMLLQFARFDARSDATGLPIRLQEQDRTKWDRPLIQAGLAALHASQRAEQMTALHLEARIAAEHAMSPSFAATQWPLILQLYDQLLLYKDTPEVRLSRIVALRYVQGWAMALHELDQLTPDTLARSFLHHAIRADLMEAASKAADAAAEWRKARTFAPTTADRVFVAQKLKTLP